MKASPFLGCISKKISSKLNEVIFTCAQYSQAALEFLCLVKGYLKGVVNKLKEIHRRADMTLRRVEDVTYEESQRDFCMWMSNCSLLLPKEGLQRAQSSNPVWCTQKKMRDSTDKLQKGKFLPGSCTKGAETGSNSQRHINKVHP